MLYVDYISTKVKEKKVICVDYTKSGNFRKVQKQKLPMTAMFSDDIFLLFLFFDLFLAPQLVGTSVP